MTFRLHTVQTLGRIAPSQGVSRILAVAGWRGPAAWQKSSAPSGGGRWCVPGGGVGVGPGHSSPRELPWSICGAVARLRALTPSIHSDTAVHVVGRSHPAPLSRASPLPVRAGFDQAVRAHGSYDPLLDASREPCGAHAASPDADDALAPRTPLQRTAPDPSRPQNRDWVETLGKELAESAASVNAASKVVGRASNRAAPRFQAPAPPGGASPTRFSARPTLKSQ